MVDVGNVAVINQEEENALLELMKEGAKFRCSGVLTKHVIQELRRRSKRQEALNQSGTGGAAQSARRPRTKVIGARTPN